MNAPPTTQSYLNSTGVGSDNVVGWTTHPPTFSFRALTGSLLGIVVGVGVSYR